MIVGVQGIGKTSLLQQIRLEGTVGKRTPPNDVSLISDVACFSAFCFIFIQFC